MNQRGGEREEDVDVMEGRQRASLTE